MCLDPCDARIGAVIFFVCCPWVLASALPAQFSTDYCALSAVLAAAGLQVCCYCVHASHHTVRSVLLLAFGYFCAFVAVVTVRVTGHVRL